MGSKAGLRTSIDRLKDVAEAFLDGSEDEDWTGELRANKRKVQISAFMDLTLMKPNAQASFTVSRNIIGETVLVRPCALDCLDHQET